MPRVEVSPSDIEGAVYTAYGNVRRGLNCTDFEVLLCGPSDTGKTLGSCWKLHLLAANNPGASLAIVRKTYQSMPGTVLRTFDKVIADSRIPAVPFGGKKPEWYEYENGSRIYVGGMDNPDRVLSAERDAVYINQLEELALADYETLTTRASGRAGVLGNNQVFSDCNPAHPSHWILARVNAGTITKFDTIHQDNPDLYDQITGEITNEGRRRIGVLDRLTGARKLRLRHGIWAAPEGAIYDVFDEDHHKVVAFPIPAHWPRAVGIDPAGAYRAAVWLAWDPDNQKLNAYRELLMPFGITVAGFVEQIKALSRNEPVFVWACGAKSERDWRTEFAAAGLPVTEPPIVDVWVGIDRVYQLLRDFQLVIHDTCTSLLSEIGGYSRAQDRDGYFTDRIADKDRFHLLDGLRYIVVWLTEPHEKSQIVYAPVQIGPRW